MSEPELIDVKQRMTEYSVEELNESAEEYFRRLENWDYLLSKPLAPPMMASLRGYLRGRRLFFLRKGDVEEALDSRRREGLSAFLEPARQRGTLKAHARVKNAGRGVWLGKSARVGAVHFGVHLYNAAEDLITHGYYVHHGLRNDDPERIIRPGEVVDLVAEFPAPAAGNYLLEFGLVSGGVTWFSGSCACPVRLAISVD